MDVYIERFTGSNILGFGRSKLMEFPQLDPDRVISFFRTEPIVGAYLLGFCFIVSGYILNYLKPKKILKIFGFYCLY